MTKDWNIRLKEAREKCGIKLKDVEKDNLLGVSQQSVIKYEKGKIFPQINVLERMCQCYHVTVDWILYGDKDFSSLTRTGNHLFLLFDLLQRGKIKKSNNSNGIYYYFDDKKLNEQLSFLSTFAEKVVLSSKEDYESLIKGIEKMNNEM